MADETRIEAVGCALHPFERNRYFYGKLLTVRDFETDQRYMMGKDHLINSHVHGSGIVCGLELGQEILRDNGNLFVDLTAGVALDCCGNEIVVSKAVNHVPVRGTPQEGRNYVYLGYAECVKEPVPALANASTCEEVCCYNRIQETYAVSISPEPPVRTDAAFVGKVEQRQASGAPAPLAGARIEALQNGMVRAATLTDKTGNYRLNAVAGTYDVRVSATGYQLVTADNRSVAARGTLSIDFVLEPAVDRPGAATLCQDMTQRYYKEHLRVCPQCTDPKVLLAVVNLPPGDGPPSVDPEETQRHRSIVYSNPMLHDLLCDHVADFHNPHGTTAADILALQSINNVGNVEGRPHVSNVDLISSNSTIQIDPDPTTQQIDLTTTPAVNVTRVGPTPAVGSSLHFAREDHVHDLADAVVSTRTLTDNAVTGPKIADDAITSPKIADDTIQLGDLHPDLRRRLGRGVNVQTFGATGDGATDDRAAIQRALEAAAVLGDEVYFPPGTYIVGRSGSNAWCLDLPGDNLTLHGVKGASWIKATPIKADPGTERPVDPAAVLRINGRSNITLSGLGIDGNWGNALTEIAAASDGVVLRPETETDTIHVKSTAGFPEAGTIQVMTSVGRTQTVHYTEVTRTPPSFKKCTGGEGTMFRGGVVGRLDDNTGINHSTREDPQNHGIQIRGSTKILIDNCLIQQTYGDGIWLGHLDGRLEDDGNVWTQDVRITNTNVNITARNGISFGQACEGIYIGHTNFTNIFVQAVDTEPQEQPVRDVVVEHCHLGGWWNPGNPDRDVNAPLSIAGGKGLTGGQTVWARKFRVRDCTIDGACLIKSAVDVVLERNRIVTDFDGKSYAPVLVSFFCDDIWVLDNEIYDRTADGSAGRHAASITVRFDGGRSDPTLPSSTTLQPSGVTVRGNRIHARNGRRGIQIVGTGARALAPSAIAPGSPAKLLPDEAKDATTVTATTLTREGAGWAVDQWQGRFVRIGEATAGIESNTADTLTLFVPHYLKTAWYTPLGTPVVTPAERAYEIYGIGGIVDIDSNDIDCTNDGHGAGGIGIHLQAALAGMRVRCRNNKIKNASGDAINVESVDEHRPFLHLVIANNHAWDDQRNSTCTAAVRFQPSPRHIDHIDRLVLCGNSVEGDIAPVVGLNSGVWLVEEGLPERWAGRVDPNGNIAAPIGAIYQQLPLDGASVLWVKQADDGQKTGWVSTESRGVNVRMFGAKGDGSTNDREAIQGAIDAAMAAGGGGVVFFPAGDYVVDKMDPPETSLFSFDIGAVPDPLVFAGVGAASIIRMKPDRSTPAGDSAMFRVSASQNVSFRHLRLDGHSSDLPPESHVHCIRIDQVFDVTVQNVEFRGPVHNGIWVRGGNNFESRRLMIAENLFIDCSVRLNSTQGVRFVSNTILGGQVSCLYIKDFVISNNIIVEGPGQDGAALNLEGEALHGAVTGNTIRAEETSRSTGIRVLPQGGHSPEKIRLSQNTILAGQTGINICGQDISVSDNVIERYPVPDVVRIIPVGINVERRTETNRGDAIQVRNNHIRDFKRAIHGHGSNETGVDLTRLVVVGNQIRGANPDRDAGEAILIGPRAPAATVYGNQVFPAETTRLLRLVSNEESRLYIVTAAGFAGDGSPDNFVAAEVGSLYTRLDGTPSLWVKETGTGPTGWVSK